MDTKQLQRQIATIKKAHDWLTGYAVQQWARDRNPNYQRNVDRAAKAFAAIDDALDAE